MIWRIALILLQAIGALSVIPYPAVLVANVMSIAGGGESRGFRSFLTAIPYVLLCFYPFAWYALDKWSWRLFARGATAAAFAPSLIPAVGTAALYFFVLRSSPPKPQK